MPDTIDANFPISKRTANASLIKAFVLVFSLIGGEIVVFIVEIIAFLILVNEHGRLRTASFVVLANLLSLIAGGYLITVLPV